MESLHVKVDDRGQIDDRSMPHRKPKACFPIWVTSFRLMVESDVQLVKAPAPMALPRREERLPSRPRTHKRYRRGRPATEDETSGKLLYATVCQPVTPDKSTLVTLYRRKDCSLIEYKSSFIPKLAIGPVSLNSVMPAGDSGIGMAAFTPAASMAVMSMSPPPMLISPSMVACVSHAAMSPQVRGGEVKGERLAASEGGGGRASQGDRGGYL